MVENASTLNRTSCDLRGRDGWFRPFEWSTARPKADPLCWHDGGRTILQPNKRIVQIWVSGEPFGVRAATH